MKDLVETIESALGVLLRAIGRVYGRTIMLSVT